MKGYLLLEDGTVLEGLAFGAETTVIGEIVFNTGMTGYQEILTDPSYGGQVVVMTYPLIGNYGINLEDVESQKIQVKGFIIKEYAAVESNWKSTKKLDAYLKEENIFGMAYVDTRMLTKRIRNKGAMNCLMTTEPIQEKHREELKAFSFPRDIVSQVSIQDPKLIPGSNKKIGCIDLGIKKGIIQQLSMLGVEVQVFPWNTDAETIKKANLDAVLFSNGPGDPKDIPEVIQTAQSLMGELPLFGICLGHQVLALALGADTYKLKFGHRGSNHPVIDQRTNKLYITSQNHGYAVANDYRLPKSLQITHMNVNDDTIEGFSCEEQSIYAVQFHPEAGPGPRDAHCIFQEWMELLEKGREDA